MVTLTLNTDTELQTIANLLFKSSDALQTDRERVNRHASLLKAVVLESLSNQEVILTLEDQTSTKKLRTRIIATGNDKVMIDKGLTLPLRCIQMVEFP